MNAHNEKAIFNKLALHSLMHETYVLQSSVAHWSFYKKKND